MPSIYQSLTFTHSHYLTAAEKELTKYQAMTEDKKSNTVTN